MKHACTSLLCALFILFASPLPVASASQASGYQPDYAADLFSGGLGTRDDPFILGSLEELTYLSHHVQEGKYQGAHFALEENFGGFAKSDAPALKPFSQGSGTKTDPYVLESAVRMASFAEWAALTRYPYSLSFPFEGATYFTLLANSQDVKGKTGGGRKPDYAADLFSGGLGTREDPFIIDSTAELAYLTHHARDNKYRGAFFVLKQRDGWLSAKNRVAASGDSEAARNSGYVMVSPTRGSGTRPDPYVFDSGEQMIYLAGFVEREAYPYGETAYFMLETESWLDYAADEYAGGDGSEESPFLIETAEQLALLAKRVKEGDSCESRHFRQTQDIDLGGRQWTPIGGAMEYNRADPRRLDQSKRRFGSYFSGVFDGGGRTISGLTITRFIHGAGLFNTLYNGVVSNVRLTKLKIAMGMNCGGVAVWAEKSKITGCEVRGDISFFFRCGGVASYIRDSEITGCAADVGIYLYADQYWASISFMEMYANTHIFASDYIYVQMAYEERVRRPETVRYSYTTGYTRVFAGGIAGWVAGGIIRDCNTRVYFYRYSDSSYMGYYGGISGGGGANIENCEAVSHDGEDLPLAGDSKRYFKDTIESFN